MRYLINDIEFEKILKFLMQIKGIHKKNTEKLRIFIEAVYYISRSGCQWRLLPYYYGDWRAIHKRFNYWSERNIWKKLFENFQENPDMEWVMIDSTIVRAHSCSAGYGKNTQEKEALGRSKGGFSTKIHTLNATIDIKKKFNTLFRQNSINHFFVWFKNHARTRPTNCSSVSLS